MGDILDLGERAWQGELEGTQVHPGNAFVGFEELASGLGFMSAFSNVATVDTDEGLVFLDTSSFFHAAQLHAGVRRWSPKRVHTAVYTHGHVDHIFGLMPFEQEARERGEPPTHVIAHESCPERFERYRLTGGFNGFINARQFGFGEPTFPRKFREPDETVRDSHVLDVGGCRIELRHDRGETDDHLWAWLPERRALYTGDLFIWASPNCGNPQKVQRYPREWARALRRMMELGAELLMPGHGPPILGAARVRQALDESARLLETIVEQTLRFMNEGARLDDVLAGVQLPEDLLARPYLRPTYDDPRFIIRNLWRLYGGWWDQNPAHLLPAPERDLARAISDLAGGAAALARAAHAQAEGDRLDLACHLVEFALAADATAPGVRESAAAIYTARARRESSLMAKGVFRAAAREAGGA